MSSVHSTSASAKLIKPSLPAEEETVSVRFGQQLAGFLPVLVPSSREIDSDRCYSGNSRLPNGSLHGVLVLASVHVQHVPIAGERRAAWSVHRSLDCVLHDDEASNRLLERPKAREQELFEHPVEHRKAKRRNVY